MEPDMTLLGEYEIIVHGYKVMSTWNYNNFIFWSTHDILFAERLNGRVKIIHNPWNAPLWPLMIRRSNHRGVMQIIIQIIQRPWPLFSQFIFTQMKCCSIF